MIVAIAILAFAAVLWVLCSPRMLWKVLQKKVFIFDKNAEGSQTDFDLLCQLLVQKQGFKIYPAQIWSDGRLLSTYYFKHPRSQLVFNFHMGRNNSLLSCVSFLRVYSRFGSVFVCEPPGFGASTGEPSFLTFSNCGIVSHRTLVQMGYTNEQIIPCGDSLGAAAATIEAAWAGSRAVILSAAFESMVRMAKEQMPILRIYPRWMFPSHTRLDNLENLRKFAGATLLLHGIDDDLIPIEQASVLRSAAPDRITLVELHARHRDTAGSDPETFETAVGMFLEIWLGNGDPPGCQASPSGHNRPGCDVGRQSRLGLQSSASSRSEAQPIANDDSRSADNRRRVGLTIVSNDRPRPVRIATDKGTVVRRPRPRLVVENEKPVTPSKDK